MSFVLTDTYLPATLAAQPMTDEEFQDLCVEHPDLNFEMTAEGELIVMAPTASDTGASNFEVDRQLGNWALTNKLGIGCDSSSGFVLPNGARRSPDASWTLRSRVKALKDRRRKSFWRLCPDFVVEIRSETDRLRPLQKKMREYLDNGAQLGWLIDPQRKAVEIYRPGVEPETRTGIDKVEGEGPVAGFVLDLTDVWDPLDDE